MDMRRALVLALIGAVVLASSSAPAFADSRPDVVVVMADDLGAIDTRVLERLPAIRAAFLEDGLGFDQAYGETPLCCPGRASFLTGQHTARHGVTRNRARLLDPSRTIATAAHDAGYHTVMAGKYLNHLGTLDRTPAGWDRVAMLESWTASTSQWSVQDKPTAAGYHDRFLIERAGAWLREAPASQPVFAWLSPRSPHWGPTVRRPWSPHVEPRFARDSRCAGITPWSPPDYRYAPKPNGWPLVATCRAMLTVDALVAEVLDALAARGRPAVVILTSDNGMAWGRDGFPVKNVPKAGRLPLYVTGAGIRTGSTSALVSNIDLGPTIADLIGAAMPWADGVSFADVLSGDGPGRAAMLEDHPLGGYTAGPWRAPWWGVRTPRWHVVAISGRPRQLFDLERDPWERTDVAAAYPDVLAELVAVGEALR